MMSAVLSSPGHPEYGVAAIPFSIPHNQYAHCMELLGALEIGNVVKVDCKVEKNDDIFNFAPDAHSPAAYSKYMIQKSGHFDYGENLDEFYDYEGYALQRMNEENGIFTDCGYIAYKGYISLAEIMDGSQSSHMEMGGMA